MSETRRQRHSAQATKVIHTASVRVFSRGFCFRLLRFGAWLLHAKVPGVLLYVGTCKSADRSRLARRTSFLLGAILPDETIESGSDTDSDSPAQLVSA